MDGKKTMNPNLLVQLTSGIVASYVRNHNVPVSEMHSLIGQVHETLATTARNPNTPPEEKALPAVPIRKSIGPDYLICLEDGEKFKSLKRHLKSKYNMTPEEYRKKWDLPDDYPMVARRYSEVRSALARDMKLGHRRRSKTLN
ncbi:transcriptional regulator [Martelella alba]|uniref:Transcriptional regulator n=1 Tax=Martelella alba TaxID=2590451 RepID=A0A506U1P6_9HYPH|nr:MucR family transcriptional regulator [Martelella alba]TPW26499.1 transcriptional regulator [Martelella alba]